MRQQHMITAILIGWLLHQAGAALGATWTVDDDGEADFDSIQAAVDVAGPQDEVVVAPGTYTGSGGYVVNMTGKSITLRASSSAQDTIIDGEQARGGIACISDEGPGTLIDGFTITRGLANDGGGVLCMSSSPTLRNLIITGNTAHVSGGGVFSSNGDPIMETCLITNNESPFLGGGIYLFNSSPRMTLIEISANQSRDGAGLFCFSSSNPRLAVCQILGNTASEDGGGIALSASSPMLSGCTIAYNTSVGDGGGIYCKGSSSPVFASCLISGNTSANNGGGFFSTSVDPDSSTLSDCTITMNSATLGGGIYRGWDYELILSVSMVCGNAPDQISGGFTGVANTIYYEGCPTGCVGDVDANGTIDIYDLLTVLENWGVCP